MLFHTVTFFWFLAAVVALALLLPRAAVMAFLLGASYVFYGWSGPFFLLLLIASTLTDYSMALYFAPRKHLRKLGIAISALVNFSLLGFFKYSSFAFSNLGPTLAAIGIPATLPALDIVLPVGISFYTFQSFAYTVDVLTGKIQPCRSLLRYALFVAWFPQLVAGPINRAGDLLPQVERIVERLRGMAERVPAAAALFAEGWLRKGCADLLIPTGDAFFANPAASTSAGAVYGIVAFGLQIYGDFSGYTKMAQGASWLFGVRLIENFNLPYAASSVRDFWRRWHISLSTWFRDYVYIPLGGNRRSAARTYFNLAVTMLLCGLWHGANWTFIAWGAAHGTLLIAERALDRFGRWIPRPAAHVLTLVFVFLAWVLFRAPTLAVAGEAYAALGHGGWALPTVGFLAGVAGIVAIDQYFRCVGRSEYARADADAAMDARPAATWRSAALVAACVAIWSVGHVLGQNQVAAFIYFQF